MSTEELNAVLSGDHLVAVFQPIFRVHNGCCRLVALEGLIRGPEGHRLELAEALFKEVRAHELETRADRACLAAIMDAAKGLQNVPRLFLNIHASTIATDVELAAILKSAAKHAEIDLQSLVLEIGQHDLGISDTLLSTRLEALREAGLKIAVGDVGAGLSALRKVQDCCPDYIKIGRHLVGRCHARKPAQKLLKSLVALGQGHGAQIIAEGVEQLEEIYVLEELGVHLVQGFLLARPHSGVVLAEMGLLDNRPRELPVRHDRRQIAFPQNPLRPDSDDVMCIEAPPDEETPMKKSILLVDDTETVLLFEKTMLRSEGFELRTANNGRIALDEVSKQRPDLILLDIMMPEVNGVQVCETLKADPQTKDIPIVMVTTKGEPEMVEQAFKAGCDDYITKPLDRMELLSKVNIYLG